MQIKELREKEDKITEQKVKDLKRKKEVETSNINIQLMMNFDSRT